MLALLERVAQFFARRGRDWPPAASEAELAALLRDLERGLRHEVERHFLLEEQSLFPILARSGDAELVALLLEEHAAVRQVAKELLPLLPRALGQALGAAEWQRLRILALELADRLGDHARKEEVSLVPALENALDERTDSELIMAYATQ